MLRLPPKTQRLYRAACELITVLQTINLSCFRAFLIAASLATQIVTVQGQTPFSPAELSPLAWYKSGTGAMNGGSSASPGQTITAWLDSSGNGNHLLSNQATAMRPTQNSGGYIQGDGGDFLSCAAINGSQTQPIRIIALAQYVNVTGSCIWANATNTQVTMGARVVTGNKLTANSGGTLGAIEGPVADSERHLYEVYYNGNSSEMRLDGFVADNSGDIGSLGINSFNLFGIYDRGNVQAGAQIKIWEVIILQGASATEVNAANVRSYFKKTFGIAVAGQAISLSPVSTQTFGSGLLQTNPSQHAAMSISEPVPGTRFLAIGDQDVAGKYGYVRKGTVHIFKEVSGTWSYHQRLSSPLIRNGQWMGHGVRAEGSWIACGNTHSWGNPNGGEGEVEVWKYNPTTDRYDYHSALQATGAAAGDEFGMLHDMDASNGWMIIGSPGYDTATANRCGRVSFYQLVGNTWVERQSLTEPGGPFTNNDFGVDVLIRGNHAFAVSQSPSPGLTGANYYRGCVYHYMLSNGIWSLNSTITPANHRSGMRFGMTMGFDGTRLVSFDWGIKNFCDGGFTVMKWNGSTWTQEYSYIDSNNPAIPMNKPHRWGHKGLFVNGDTIVASERFAEADWTGIPDMDGPPTAKGVVYVFKRSGTMWNRSHVIAPATRQPGDFFGDLMYMDGTHKLLVVSTGAYRNSQKTMILQQFDLNGDSILPPAQSDLLTVYPDSTNPNWPTESGITIGGIQPDGLFKLNFSVQPDKISVLEHSTDLQLWTPKTTSISGGRYYTYYPGGTRGFFRLKLQSN